MRCDCCEFSCNSLSLEIHYSRKQLLLAMIDLAVVHSQSRNVIMEQLQSTLAVMCMSRVLDGEHDSV